MPDLIGWLDDHSGSIAALATIVLAILTGVYVYLTSSIATAAREQSRAFQDERRAYTKSWVLALFAAYGQIHDAVKALPDDRAAGAKLRAATLWTQEDLRDLEHGTRQLRMGTAAAASALVTDLRWLEETIRPVQRAEDRGYDWEKFPWHEYLSRRVGALAMLEELDREFRKRD